MSGTGMTGGRLIRVTLWLVAGASLALPGHHLIATEIAILALFALSLDLILGFAGILSLGHGAFFGVGAYTAGLVSTRWTAEPLTGLALAAGAAGLLGLVTGPLLAVLGILLVGSLSEGSLTKGIFAGALGIAIGTGFLEEPGAERAGLVGGVEAQ